MIRRTVEAVLLAAGLWFTAPALLVQLLVQRKPALRHGAIPERIRVTGASKLL